MFERFTREARAVVVRAESEARDAGSGAIEAEHLLLALTDTAPMRAQGIGHADLLAALETQEERALAAVGVRSADFDVPRRPNREARIRFGASAKRALERALKAAVARKDKRILAEHLVLGVVAAEAGTVPRALRAGGFDAAGLVEATELELARRRSEPDPPRRAA